MICLLIKKTDLKIEGQIFESRMEFVVRPSSPQPSPLRLRCATTRYRVKTTP